MIEVVSQGLSAVTRGYMSMQNKNTSDFDTIIKIVRTWPAPQRFTLVQEVLVSLANEVQENRHRQPTLSRARGLLATKQPTLSDTDIDAMLEERRRERYGL